MWQKRTIPKVAEGRTGVDPKGGGQRHNSQFHPISAVNVEEKVFFSGNSWRVATHLSLRRNESTGTSAQWAGILGLSVHLEHSSTIWHRMKMVELEK